jgi:hypothetical protein
MLNRPEQTQVRLTRDADLNLHIIFMIGCNCDSMAEQADETICLHCYTVACQHALLGNLAHMG